MKSINFQLRIKANECKLHQKITKTQIINRRNVTSTLICSYLATIWVKFVKQWELLQTQLATVVFIAAVWNCYESSGVRTLKEIVSALYIFHLHLCSHFCSICALYFMWVLWYVFSLRYFVIYILLYATKTFYWISFLLLT